MLSLADSNRVMQVGSSHVVYQTVEIPLKDLGCGLDGGSGIRRQDVERKDRQNFETVVRACGFRVTDHLKTTGKHKGEVFYLSLISQYLRCFLSTKESIIWRVEAASYVMNALRIWRGFVFCAAGMHLDQQFLSR